MSRIGIFPIHLSSSTIPTRALRILDEKWARSIAISHVFDVEVRSTYFTIGRVKVSRGCVVGVDTIKLDRGTFVASRLNSRIENLRLVGRDRADGRGT